MTSVQPAPASQLVTLSGVILDRQTAPDGVPKGELLASETAIVTQQSSLLCELIFSCSLSSCPWRPRNREQPIGCLADPARVTEQLIGCLGNPPRVTEQLIGCLASVPELVRPLYRS
ncbi:hypothetical protein NN561_001778 [Cricetulus griseus]